MWREGERVGGGVEEGGERERDRDKMVRGREEGGGGGGGGGVERKRPGDLKLLRCLLALRTKEGAVSQGTRAASRSWKKQGNGLSSGASRGNAVLLTLRF